MSDMKMLEFLESPETERGEELTNRCGWSTDRLVEDERFSGMEIVPPADGLFSVGVNNPYSMRTFLQTSDPNPPFDKKVGVFFCSFLINFWGFKAL